MNTLDDLIREITPQINIMKKTLALLALAVVTTTAQAGTPTPSGKGVIAPTVEPESAISYSNVSLSEQIMSGTGSGPLGADLDSNGIALALEYSPVKNLYVAAGGSWNDIEGSVNFLGGVPISVDIGDYWTANAGVGGYIPLNNNIHFVTEVGLNYVDSASGGLDALGGLGGLLEQIYGQEWGFYATPHVRAKFGKFEAHLGVNYNSNNLAINDWTAFLRLLYEVNPHLDLFVAGNLGLTNNNLVQDLVGVNFGLRLKF